MLLIKLVGIILVVISSGFYGFYHIQKIKFHINDLQQISDALEILSSEIKFGTTPLSEAAKNICRRSKSFVKELFFKINKLLDDKKICASEIWRQSINNINMSINKNFLDKDDIFLLNLFTDVITSPDPELQIKYLNKIVTGLQKKILILEKQYQNEKKLYYNLGFLFGLLVITIFI